MMYIKQTKESDIESFTPSHDDKLELEAMTGHQYTRAFFEGRMYQHRTQTNCVTLWHEGREYSTPVAIGGNKGDCVWFITSSVLKFYPRQAREEFRKAIVEYRDKMLELYPVIWNYVWSGNVEHIRLLKTLGAEFPDGHDLKIAETGEVFKLFLIRRDNV